MKALRTYVFVSLCLVINCHVLLAQQFTLKGSVVDEGNRTVDFVTVNLLGNDSSTTVQTSFTDSTGRFTFQVKAGNYLLVLEQFGQRLLRKEIQVSQHVDIGHIMITRTIALEGVTVTSNKKIVERQFDKIIFNVANSPLKQGFSGLEVLKRSPELRVNSQGNLQLRNENVLVMVNGRKMNFSAEELTNYLNSLHSENIKSIEIQTIGSSDTDASNAGGVVNIVLKKAPTGFQSTIRSAYSYRDANHDAYTAGVTNQFGSAKFNIYNKINYSKSANLSKFNSTTDFFDKGRNDNNGESDNRNRNFNTTTGIVFYPSKQHEIGAEVYYSNGRIKRDGWEELLVYNPAHSATSGNLSLYKNKNDFWNITLNYTYKIDAKGSVVKFIGDAGNNKLDNRNEVDTRYTFGTLSDSYYRYLTNARSAFANLQLDWLQKMGHDWELTAGAKYARVNRDNQLHVFLHENAGWKPTEGNQDFDNEEQVVASYATIAKQWQQKHSVKLGLRSEKTNMSGVDNAHNTTVSRDYFDLFPNLFYSYAIKSDQTIAITYARRITRPGFRDLNPFVIKQNDFLYQTGNPNIQPQYTNKIDLSYRLKNHSLSLYGSFSNDLIVGVYSVENNVTWYKPQNFGKSKVTGLVYSYTGDITKWLYANITTGAWYYDFETGNNKYNRLSYYNTLSLQVKFSKTFFLDIASDYTSSSQSNVIEFYNQYQLDLGLQKNILHNAGVIRLSCDDIFNTQRNRNISRYETFNFRFYQKLITRYPTLTFTYTIRGKNKVNNKNVQKGNDNINRL